MNSKLVRSNFKIKSESAEFLGALEIAKQVRDGGFQVVFAGGCVRDALLGEEPKDFDLVTTASVEDLKQLFSKVILVGESFGVVKVPFQGFLYEVAQFRSEADYRDGRHPSLVRAGTEQEDALRRDFTVNALFWDPVNNQVLDWVGGVEDLKAGVLRAVGNPDQRFKEDHLRILRLFRFAARFGFSIEPKTLQAAEMAMTSVTTLSRERVRDELVKLATFKVVPKILELMIEKQLFLFLFPGLVKRDRHLDCDLLGRLSGLDFWYEFFWQQIDDEKTICSAVESLKLSNPEKRDLREYLWWRAGRAGQERPAIGFQRSYQIAWSRWQPVLKSLFGEQNWWIEIEKFKAANEVLPGALVRAEDLPFYRGPLLGRALRQAYEMQLENLDLTREDLIRSLTSTPVS